MDDEWEKSSEELLESSRFWIQKVLVPIMVCIGIGGNIITVMVLTRRRMRCSTNVYLTALAVTDIVFLLFVFVLSFGHYDNIHDRKYELYWRFFGITHWLCDAASNASIWLTVSFTLERYIAVCYPIKGKVLCTESRAKSIIVIVAILCILTSASTTFEYELAMNETCIRNCTREELRQMHHHMHRAEGNSLQNATIHYDLQNNNIVVTGLQNNNDVPITNAQIVRDIYSHVQPRMKSLLSTTTATNNCSNHPHIIYAPIYNTFRNVPSSSDDPSKLLKSGIVENNGANSHRDQNGGEVSALRRAARSLQEETSSSGKDNTTDSNVLGDNVPNVTTTTSWTEEKIQSEDGGEDGNSTFWLTDVCCEKNYSISTGPTKLGKNQTYKDVIYWYTVLFFWLLPLVLIATLNCFLILAVYRSQRRRRKMTNEENIPMSNENRITVMLIGVVILFLICQTPTAIFLLYDNYSTAKDAATKNIKLMLGNIFNFLLTLNAACNFLLYCVLSKKYRDTFKSLFLDRKKKRQDTMLLSSTRRTSQRHHTVTSATNGFRRNETYHTPRNLETQSLTSIPRSQSLMVRPPGKAKSTDLVV